MTNLKKVIALTLASSLALSSVASAAFTDVSDIANEDAVTTLTALGVINGYTDGTFRPDNTVTRAEMAKMIFTIKNGGSDDASAFAGIYTEFSDVESHWAAGYIKFCENTGIIAGYTDGTFKPDEEVTGVEALKMALVALGYNAEKAGLTGTYWSQNTISKSVLTGLTDDVTNFAADCTRENAAQILYNALYADMVKWDSSSEDFVDKYSLVNKTLAEDAMSLVEYEGVVSKVGEDKVYITTYDGTSFAENDTSFDATEDYTADIGSFVTVLANSDKDVFGLKVDSDTKVVIDYIDNLDDSGDTYKDYEVETEDGETIDGFTKVEYDKIADANAYDKVIIAQNDIDDAVRVTVIPTNVGNVTYAGSEYIRVQFSTSNGSSAYYYADEIIADGIDTDDCYVTVTNSAFLGCSIIEIMDKQTGTVDGLKAESTAKRFSIDGTYYAILDGTVASYGDELTYVAIDNYIFWVTDATGDVDVSDYIFLAEAASAVTPTDSSVIGGDIAYWQAIIIDTDGNESTIKIAKNDGDDNAVDYDGAKPTVGLYTYDTDDGFYMLTAIDTADFEVDSDTGITADKFDEDNGEIDKIAISDDAIFFVSYDDGSEYELVTGAELKTWSEDDVQEVGAIFDIYVLEGSNSFEEIVLGTITIAGDELPGAATKLFGYVTGGSYQIQIDGDNYVVVKLFNGEEEVTYYTEGKLADFSISTGNAIWYTIDADGYITIKDLDDSNYTYGVFAVQAVTSSSVRFFVDPTDADAGYTSKYSIEDDTAIIFVDTANDDGIIGGVMSKAYQLNTDGEYVENVFAVIDEANAEVVAIYFDVNSEYEGAGICK
ncbi:MAG: S-layer homology domain-containing protein [Clostridia bacterium]